MSSLPANTGWSWLKQGLGMFRAQPGLLTMVLFANLLASIMLSVVPLVGPVIPVLLLPSFSMAIMMTCHMITEGQRATPAVLMTGFRNPEFRALCKLGLVYVGVFGIVMVLQLLLLSDEFRSQIASARVDRRPPSLNRSEELTALGIYLLYGLMLLALTFAVPLTYWRKMPVGKAVFYSIFGTWGALRPILMLLLSSLGIIMGVMLVVRLFAVVSTGISQMLMIWVAIVGALVVQCALYAAYRQIFGVPGAQEPPAGDQHSVADDDLKPPAP